LYLVTLSKFILTAVLSWKKKELWWCQNGCGRE